MPESIIKLPVSIDHKTVPLGCTGDYMSHTSIIDADGAYVIGLDEADDEQEAMLKEIADALNRAAQASDASTSSAAGDGRERPVAPAREPAPTLLPTALPEGAADCAGAPIDHEEAWSLACHRRLESNLARCYMALRHAINEGVLEPAQSSIESCKPVAWLYEAEGFADAFSKKRLRKEWLRGAVKETPLYAAPPSSTRCSDPDVDKLIDEILAADPYTSYAYVAQNSSVEQERATKHARTWMRELARKLGSFDPSAKRDTKA